MKAPKALSSPSYLREEDGLRLPPPAQVPIPEASQNPCPCLQAACPEREESLLGIQARHGWPCQPLLEHRGFEPGGAVKQAFNSLSRTLWFGLLLRP